MSPVSSGDVAPGARPVVSRGWLSLGVFALIGLTAYCATLESQSTRRPTAVMLKRIAEAVDGNRTGAEVYVVVSFAPTNPVLGVFESLKEAEDLARREGSDAFVSGGIQTVLDTVGAHVSLCVHTGYRSMVQPERCVPTKTPLLPQEIAGMTLVISRTNGSFDTIPVPPDADAIFLGLPAIDKFVIPYYLRTLGLATVSDMRREFQQAFTPGVEPKR